MPDARNHESSRNREMAFVLSLFLGLACIMTWPLAAGLTTDVPGDLGDSLLNMWILGWGAEHLPRVLTGQMALGELWNANIFFPEPLTLALSETLLGQVVQILPVYALTHNLILCYNLLFLTTFAISGLGMYLLVREFTGNRSAAFLAGLLFAFVPYRVAQIPHLQTMSSQWMPFVLLGFRRYITTRSKRALLGGAVALVLQNLSCGYYLIYFAPFVLLFVLHQIFAAGRAREAKIWVVFAVAAAAVGLAAWPVLRLYLDAQGVHPLDRPTGEIIGFSADVYSYLTASNALRVIGGVVNVWPKPEGELFLGLVATLLAAFGLVAAGRDARASAPASEASFRQVGGRRFSARGALTLLLGLALVTLAASLAIVVFSGGFVTSLAGIPIRATSAPRLVGELAIVTGALMLFSPGFRHVVATMTASSTGIAMASLVLALWLSLGPIAHARGQTIEGFGLYAVLLDYVPGFAGLRVPARYAMVAALYLTILAGLGASRLKKPVIVTAAALFLVEAWIAPMAVNQTWGEGGFIPPARVEPASSAPRVYHYLATLPDDVAVLEFPFGDPAWELRYVYYSTVHWKPILNGYSGSFPQHYKYRVARLQRIREDPEAAATELERSGHRLHVIVHEDAMSRDDAVMLRAWLEGHGFREIGRFGNDVLYKDTSFTL